MEKPDTPNEPDSGAGDESLQALMDRARRAHELVDAVDFQKVTAHDPTEVDKLHGVADALGELAHGEAVEHVEGVDEVVPQLSEDQQRKTALFTTLADAGFADNLGRVLHNLGEAQQLLPLDLIPHTQGLPAFDLCVAPGNATGNGNFGIFVSASGIFAASINEPTNKHHWRIARSRPYDNEDELIQSIQQFTTTAFE